MKCVQGTQGNSQEADAPNGLENVNVPDFLHDQYFNATVEVMDDHSDDDEDSTDSDD